jgi:magnesium chelatase subunit H
LDKDVKLPEEGKELSQEERDLVIGNVYRKLMEIESRLLPCGLHIVGQPPTAEEAVATLVNIAEIDRPDQKPEPIPGLPGILARAVGRDIEQIYAGNNKGVLADVDLLQRITQASREAVREFVKDRTGIDGRIGKNWLTVASKFVGLYTDPYVRALQGSEFASADRNQLITVFNYLEFCLEQVRQRREVWCRM